jgi:A/G-specific adenine glycosylase
VLDGNVVRVLTRLLGDSGEVSRTDTRQRLQSVAQALLDRRQPGEHNQAVMELGALVCVPAAPRCDACPLRRYCTAHRDGVESELPAKKRKTAVRRLRRKLLVAIRNGHILLWQRPHEVAKLSGFWELPEPNQLPAADVGLVVHRFSHAITNHLYDVEVVHAIVEHVSAPLQWLPLASLRELPLSTLARKALRIS